MTMHNNKKAYRYVIHHPQLNIKITSSETFNLPIDYISEVFLFPTTKFGLVWFGFMAYYCYVLLTIQLNINCKRSISLVSSEFTNSPGDQGSIPGRVMLKTKQMVLDVSLLNTRRYKVGIDGKVEQFRERCSALPTIRCCSYWKVAFGSPSTTVTFTYSYILDIYDLLLKSTKLSGSNHCYVLLTIQLNINHLFTLSISTQCSSIWPIDRTLLGATTPSQSGAMAKRGYSAFSKAPTLRKPNNQIV